ASIILKKYPNLGLRLSMNKRDLPLKKGLSSSAATCVLVARAFNRIHDLNLSEEEEMEFAYRGELLTGSLCGRMDQACAYGRNPVLLTFDGDEMIAEPLNTGEPLYFLIVDLQAEKNTRKILEDLNTSFSSGNRMIRQALGKENHRITTEACNAIEKGDPKHLGELMTEAQRVFDEMVAPLCPSELTAPKLHRTLLNEAAGDLAWGGKGVGSQGDGTAQFICKSNPQRKLLKDRLESEMSVDCYNLTL
ncbi:MAG: GHMP kinase, partial [Candidatus Fermentibacteria bacterium]|nr:GHMP kinase [Candidatus Fermentibacteria bacterium]